MGCFTACFHTCKINKKKKNKLLKPSNNCNKINSISPKALQNLLEITQEKVEVAVLSNSATKLDALPPVVANPSNVTAESKNKVEEEGLSGSSIKKVTFDVNCGDKVTETKEEDEGNDYAHSDSSTVSSYISYPPNHRYHCCRNSEDEFDVIDLDNSNVEDNANNDNEYATIQEESSESLFSLSIDSRKRNDTIEIGDKEEVNSPLKLRGNRSQCVLNPIANLSHWRVVTKAITEMPSTLKHDEEKENINLMNGVQEQQPRLKQLTKQTDSQKDQIAVDTSLSSWLVDTPNSKNSIGSVGNTPSERINSPIRLVLGALPVTDVKDSQRSPSYCSDDKTVIGTVGSYWRRTGPNQATDSDSASSSCRGISSVNSGLQENSNFNSTPFQARLERAVI